MDEDTESNAGDVAGGGGVKGGRLGTRAEIKRLVSILFFCIFSSREKLYTIQIDIFGNIFIRNRLVVQKFCYIFPIFSNLFF